MSFFNIFGPKKTIKEEPIPQKKYYTFEEIEAIACKGFKDKWCIGIKNNPNLFPAMFEWVAINEYKQVLKFKHFRTDKDNYAPYITYISDKPDVFFMMKKHLLQYTLKLHFLDMRLLSIP